ncbi:MAG: DNA-binding protein [Gammaproteobacteria bacterium]|nr:MAG: DNA-binding protein [Burkholderiaceae bacterium]
MSEPTAPEDRRLEAEIDALRAKFTDTQELYREVCTLLFFRHSITPTANKLYQLVRKGSMSAPSEALSRFWASLREKSRVRIEHPDLPVELRDIAGEAVGALWQRAQALAQESLAAARGEAQASALAAQAAAEAVGAEAEGLRQVLAETREQLQAREATLRRVEQGLARERGETAALQRQVEDAGQQRRELQEAMQATSRRFAHELEQQRAGAAAAQEQHAADMRRILLDVDRERTAAAKAQKELEQARRVATEQAEKHGAALSASQQERAQLGQRLGEVEGALAETRAARDMLARQLGRAVTAKALKLVAPARKRPASKA